MKRLTFATLLLAVPALAQDSASQRPSDGAVAAASASSQAQKPASDAPKPPQGVTLPCETTEAIISYLSGMIDTGHSGMAEKFRSDILRAARQNPKACEGK